MRVLIQRVREASVTVDGSPVGKTGYGYLLLAGFSDSDSEETVRQMAEKTVNLRICDDENHKMNRSLLDIQGEILSISQFTLYADTRKGRRPSFTQAGEPERSLQLYEYFNSCLREYGLRVETGIFAADMKVALINDGPVTIMLDSDIILKKQD